MLVTSILFLFPQLFFTLWPTKITIYATVVYRTPEPSIRVHKKKIWHFLPVSQCFISFHVLFPFLNQAHFTFWKYFQYRTFCQEWTNFQNEEIDYLSHHHPFPNKPWFLHVCSTSFLKIMWKKEKLLVMSNFSFFHNIFYPFNEIYSISIEFEINICKLFQFRKV